MTFIDKIITEALIPTSSTFSKVNSNFYGFIQRDVTKFPTFEEKQKIVNKIETLRMTSGKGLPKISINPFMLVATQKEVESKNAKKLEKVSIPPFVVKLNNVYFLLDGNHRVFNAIKDKKKEITVSLLDLDKV